MQEKNSVIKATQFLMKSNSTEEHFDGASETCLFHFWMCYFLFPIADAIND